ncbi:MAG: UDP-2,3-diacylglucosamine diphosphatase LpxI [Phycisphaerales bacterium]|nr:UDP-2,3-diacylglucosamine diphosphatase LpxI [Phycisphaerales bacterium]
MATTAIIAGQGDLPVLSAHGARAAGRRVIGIGLRNQYVPDFPSACDEFVEAGVMQPGRWLKVARRMDVQDAVLIGRVSKRIMHEKSRLRRALRELPDLYAINLWYRRLRHDHRTSVLLRTLADDLAQRGLLLVDSTTYLDEHLATRGTMGGIEPSALAEGDMAFAWPLLLETSRLHVGQSIAVRERDVISVEAVEGTDALIERTGGLCPRGGWTLCKTAAPDHDMRADVPTIGVRTIENAASAGCSCIALGTGRVILADRPAVIAAADRAGIALVGIGDGDGDG